MATIEDISEEIVSLTESGELVWHPTRSVGKETDRWDARMPTCSLTYWRSLGYVNVAISGGPKITVDDTELVQKVFRAISATAKSEPLSEDDALTMVLDCLKGRG